MSKLQDNFIVPLALSLDKHVEKDIYFLSLPGILKERLTRMEELSRNGRGKSGRFIREKDYLPLNSLKKLFSSYLPGVTDMKAVGYSTDDKRWLISLEPIDLSLVVKIMKVWIEAFYIAETELERKRHNDDSTKQYAKQVINELDIECFAGCAYVEKVVLFDHGEVVDKDAYSLLPLIAVEEIVGTEVSVDGRKAKWMYSKKHEIVTDPLAFQDVKGEDYFSYVASFSVQTIPPYNKPYLNVKVVSRRWISRNASKEVPYYKDEKSVYARIDDKKLQIMHAKYMSKEIGFDWVYADKKLLSGLYGLEYVVGFQDIICNPSHYMKGIGQKDFYVVYEYGMKDGYQKMHNQDAGISPMDRREVFEDIASKLTEYSGGSKIATKETGNDNIIQTFFEDDFSLKESMRLKFQEMVDSISGKQNLNIEVCYSAGQEVLREAIIDKLKAHFTDTKVTIKAVPIDALVESLSCNEESKPTNLEGFNERIREVKEVMGMANEPTFSIVIIHIPDYYKWNGKTDSKVDPKNALRVGFANTKRLTQFVTFEKYLETEKERLKSLKSGKNEKKNGEIKKTYAVNTGIRETILDTYRQMGIHNYLVKSETKTTLHHKVAVGIYVVNYKNLMNDIAFDPFPLIVSCDMIEHSIMVETQLCVLSKVTKKKESIEKISCSYMEFPIRLREMLAKIGSGKRIIPSERFLCDWFEERSDNKNYEIMIAANGTSRKMLEGISNKEIMEYYDEGSGNVSKMGINGNLGYEIDMKEYTNIDLLRIRTNDEVPDYILKPNDEKEVFEESRGVYKFDTVYYSKDERTYAEYKNTKQSTTKLEDNKAFLHRNIIEIYPMYINDRTKELSCVKDVHDLRSVSIQYEAGKTILPMPLHLAKLLEEYLV